MKRRHIGLSLFLGLMLLVQGFAITAPPVVAANEPASVVMEGKCHGMQPVESEKSCCDAECPDMSACLLGHLVVSVAAASLATMPPLSPSPDFQPIPVSVWTPVSLLRPPIALLS